MHIGNAVWHRSCPVQDLPRKCRKIQNRIGRPTVASRQAAKSRPEPGTSRHAVINVITYIKTSNAAQISAAICFGVFFFIGILTF